MKKMLQALLIITATLSIVNCASIDKAMTSAGAVQTNTEREKIVGTFLN